MWILPALAHGKQCFLTNGWLRMAPPTLNRSRAANAKYQADYRRREASGLAVARVEYDEHGTLETLIAAGRLSRVSALDPTCIAEALGDLIRERIQEISKTLTSRP